MPGRWLLAIARLIFDEAVLTTVIYPTVADLQREWLDAADISNRILARGRGYLAFWSLMVMAPIAFRNWPGRLNSRRAFWSVTALLGAVVVVVVVWTTTIEELLSPILNNLPEGTMSRLSAAGSLAFLAGPVAVAFALAAGSLRGGDHLQARTPALLFFSLISIPAAALIATAGVWGTFEAIGRQGSAGLGTVSTGVTAATEPLFYAIVAAASGILVCGLLAVRPVRNSVSASGTSSSLGAAVGASVVLASLVTVDQLLRHQHESLLWLRMLLDVPSPSGLNAAQLAQRMEHSISLVMVIGTLLTVALPVTGIILWRSLRTGSAHPLLTWTSRGAVVLALAGCVWHGAVIRADVQAIRDVFTTAARSAP